MKPKKCIYCHWYRFGSSGVLWPLLSALAGLFTDSKLQKINLLIIASRRASHRAEEEIYTTYIQQLNLYPQYIKSCYKPIRKPVDNGQKAWKTTLPKRITNFQTHAKGHKLKITMWDSWTPTKPLNEKDNTMCWSECGATGMLTHCHGRVNWYLQLSKLYQLEPNTEITRKLAIPFWVHS